MTKNIIIREGSIDEVVELSKEIPEFDQPHEKPIYKNRLFGKDHIILVANVGRAIAGFKVGYDKFDDGSFYTWMGGVKAEFRRMGIARKLANKQEEYVRQHGYNSIVLKTRNRHKNMLIFAINSGFKIKEILPNQDIDENRVVLIKPLI